MDLSYVIVSSDRRDTLLRTLGILERTTPLPQDRYETWVVDNGSRDGTRAAVAAAFPRVKLLRLEQNEGVWARSLAFERCAGRYITLLDDDSYPTPQADTLPRSIAYLDANPRVAALTGRCVLPDGRLEACALPEVLLSCAVTMRKAALEEVGGFRREFFRKAGEYDLSFRLWQAGWSVQRCDDLSYQHDKHTADRCPALAFRMDLRNNLILVERFLPPAYRRAYRRDYLQRYAALARHEGQDAAMREALVEARQWARREREAGRQTLDDEVLEILFAWGAQQRAIAAWAERHEVRHVVLADYSKNLYATWRAAQRCGLGVTAVAENHPALVGLRYRGVAVRRDREALDSRADGVILSNVNPAVVERRAAELRRRWAGPLLTLYAPRLLALSHGRARAGRSAARHVA